MQAMLFCPICKREVLEKTKRVEQVMRTFYVIEITCAVHNVMAIEMSENLYQVVNTMAPPKGWDHT